MRSSKIVVVYAIFTIVSLVSESLLGKTPATMAILQKCLGTFLPGTKTMSLTLIVEKFKLNFDFRCVSRKFTTYSCLHLSQK